MLKSKKCVTCDSAIEENKIRMGDTEGQDGSGAAVSKEVVKEDLSEVTFLPLEGGKSELCMSGGRAFQVEGTAYANILKQVCTWVCTLAIQQLSGHCDGNRGSKGENRR